MDPLTGANTKRARGLWGLSPFWKSKNYDFQGSPYRRRGAPRPRTSSCIRPYPLYILFLPPDGPTSSLQIIWRIYIRFAEGIFANWYFAKCRLFSRVVNRQYWGYLETYTSAKGTWFSVLFLQTSIYCSNLYIHEPNVKCSKNTFRLLNKVIYNFFDIHLTI